MQLLIPFLWDSPAAKTHSTWCSVAVVRFQPVVVVVGGGGVGEEEFVDRGSTCV